MIRRTALDYWLDWFGRHSIDWLETLVRCTGIHNYLTRGTFTAFEKQFLANGLRFIVTPSTSAATGAVDRLRKHFVDDPSRGWLRFVRSLHNSLWRADPETRAPSKFILPPRSFGDRSADEHRQLFSSELFHLDRYCRNTLQQLNRTICHQTLSSRMNCHRKDQSFVCSLMEDSSITCKPADKNLGLVLIDTDWYNAELGRMLKDTVTYCNVRPAPGRTMRSTVTSLIGGLSAELKAIVKRHTPTLERWSPAQHEQIIKYMHNKIAVSSAMIPEIYLLIKVHKPKGLCGRPIVPCTRWITTPASVLADHLLQEVLKKAAIPWLVRDTKSLVNDLETRTVTEPHGIFVTADIASLYTNIDTQRGLQLVRLFLTEQLVDERHSNLIMDLLRFVMDNSYLSFRGQLFHQRDGTAMGTACAPSYANIVVYMLERPVVELLAPTGLFFYRRYLDDLLAFVAPEKAQELQLRMNALDPKLVFEFVSNEAAAEFLDLHIHKGKRFVSQGRFDLAVHQKKMNLYLYIPFSSFHTDAAKRSFIQTELMRYIRNSSDRDAYLQLKRLFYQRLRDRGYPSSFLLPVFNSIFYEDRALFLHPSADLLTHPLLLQGHQPRSTCLQRRIHRAQKLALLINSSSSSSNTDATQKPPAPPVFIIPFTPLSAAIPTRQLLTTHWQQVNLAIPTLPRPIIAYQSFPSLMVRLVHQKARRSAEQQPQLWHTDRSVQSKLSFHRLSTASDSSAAGISSSNE